MLESRLEILQSEEYKFYIEKFKGEVFVIKYGGAALENEAIMPSFLKDLAAIQKSGIQIVLVHGGGKLLTRYMNDANLPVQFVDGMRKTSQDVIPLAIRAFSDLNAVICQSLKSAGIDCQPILGHENSLVELRPMDPETDPILRNFVATVSDVDVKKLGDISKTMPVITSLGQDQEGHVYNINADLVASAVAQKLKARKLIFISDVNGIYRDAKDPSTHISHINRKEINELIKTGILVGGMRLKVEMALEALDAGVAKIHFINGSLDGSVLKEIFTHQGFGTEIVED